MAVVLALEPNPAQAAILRRLMARVPGAELILVDTKDAALLAIEQRVPALILTSPLLPPGDEAELAARLRALPNGDRVQTLCTPIFSTAAPPKGGLLHRWRDTHAAQAADDAAVFARSIAAYLPHVPAGAARRSPPSPPPPRPGPPRIQAAAKAAPRRMVKRRAAAKAKPPGRPFSHVMRPVSQRISAFSISARRQCTAGGRIAVRGAGQLARGARVYGRKAASRIAPLVRGLVLAVRGPIVHAWASPRLRTAFAVSCVALLAGAPSRNGSAPMPPAVVEVRANFGDTEILLDGAARGRPPLRLHLTPGAHELVARRQGMTRTTQLYVSSGAHAVESIEWPLPRPAGTLKVTTTPTGARVTVDGKVRGVTPLTIEQLKPGSYKVLLESRAGTVQTRATVADGETAVLDVPIFAGWIAVFAPVQLQIKENGRVLGTSESGRIMVPPGRHVLRLSNAERSYESTHVVEVLPGEVEAISITEIP